MFRSMAHMDNNINLYLKQTPQFDLMPPTPDSYEIYTYTTGRKIPYKICPETDCEEVSPVGEPSASLNGGSTGQSSSWNRGSQKRGASAPPGRGYAADTTEYKSGPPEETPLPRHDGEFLTRSRMIMTSCSPSTTPRTPAQSANHQLAY